MTERRPSLPHLAGRGRGTTDAAPAARLRRRRGPAVHHRFAQPISAAYAIGTTTFGGYPTDTSSISGGNKMYRLLAAVLCIVSSAAAAQEESKLALGKWRACADAAAVRYAKSQESAQV